MGKVLNGLLVVLHDEMELSYLLGIANGLHQQLVLCCQLLAFLEKADGGFRLPPLAFEIRHSAQHLQF